MSMLTAQTDHLREMAYTVERVKNDAVGKLSLSGSIALATAAMDMRDAADAIARLRNTCQDLQSDNEKLRELCSDLMGWIAYTTMGESVPEETCCVLEDRMRELGVEV